MVISSAAKIDPSNPDAVAGAPTTAIVDLAAAKSVYLVSLDESHISDLLASSPYYSAYTIKAGAY
jgi:TRAP-type uncharacterized transport system substrate-binding protein